MLCDALAAVSGGPRVLGVRRGGGFVCVCGWRFVCVFEGVGVLWGFLVCEGVRVFVRVLVLV